MKLRKLITLIGGLAIAWSPTYAQQSQSGPPKRIALLSRFECPLPDDPTLRTGLRSFCATLHRRLEELGWIEGRTIAFECISMVGRWDQLPVLAREVVSKRPDVLIAVAPAAVMALKGETTAIPIVMINTPEPERMGLITNLARPEGNVTGIAWFSLFPKQMELLKEIVPHLKRVAYAIGVSEMTKIRSEIAADVARRLGFTSQVLVNANDYDEAFARVGAERFDAACISPNSDNLQNATRIVQLALLHKIPTAGESSWWAKRGLLVSYGQEDNWATVRAAEYIDKILRGAKPSDLPVEQAPKLELVINLKTAKALGLSISPALLARADEVIE